MKTDGAQFKVLGMGPERIAAALAEPELRMGLSEWWTWNKGTNDALNIMTCAALHTAIAVLIAEAVAEEREACARLVRPGSTLREIAAAIRGRP